MVGRNGLEGVRSEALDCPNLAEERELLEALGLELPEDGDPRGTLPGLLPGGGG